jgi:type I restriction enzyme M protein
MYFENSSSTWYRARKGDVVFSSIDLWKGCIAVVPEEFDGALDPRLDPLFLATLLRSRYYQRAFRAITTGHSNRRRTQIADFESLEICFPPDINVQRELVKEVNEARATQQSAQLALKSAMLKFSNLIDGRGDEEFFDYVEDDDDVE